MGIGLVFYRGQSQLTGDPVIGLLTGLSGESLNPKTGPIAQAWVLRADKPPMDAVRDGSDDAICGDCGLRGDGAYGRGCYVSPWQAANSVWKAHGGYIVAANTADTQAMLEGRTVRLCAYGDPAALPFEVWEQMLATTAGWVAYTHQWKRCDPRFKRIAMASVDSVPEWTAATVAGWRTFRIRGRRESLMHGPLRQGRVLPLEFVCPASEEGGKRATCRDCLLCRGTSVPARSVAIFPHGKPGNLTVFRNRSEARR